MGSGESGFLQFLLSVGVILLILAGQGSASDDQSDPYHLKPDKSDRPFVPIELGILGTTRGTTEDFARGWGGTGIADITYLKPVIFRFSFSFTSARAESGLIPRVSGNSSTFDLGVLLRPNVGHLRPYGGGGLTYISNSAPFEPPDQYVAGGYESSESFVYKLGSGFGWHMRGGTLLKLSAMVSLVLDLKWQDVHPTITFDVIEYPPFRQYKQDVKYSFSALYISVGVVFAIRAPD